MWVLFASVLDMAAQEKLTRHCYLDQSTHSVTDQPHVWASKSLLKNSTCVCVCVCVCVYVCVHMRVCMCVPVKSQSQCGFNFQAYWIIAYRGTAI